MKKRQRVRAKKWRYISTIKQLLTVIFLFCFSTISVAQELTIISNISLDRLILREQIGSKKFPLDTFVFADGKLTIPTKDLPTGFYEIAINDTNKFDFIVSKEDVVFEITSKKMIEGAKVLQSKENYELWGLREKTKEINTTVKQIQRIISFLQPADSVLKNTLQNRIDSLNVSRSILYQETAKNNQGLYIAKIAMASDFQKNHKQTKEYQKEHFFDDIDFSDKSIVRSAALVEIYMHYFYNYTNFSETGFKQSVDRIMRLSEASPEVKEFTLNYLLELFERVGPQYVFHHLIENYLLADGCSDDVDAKYTQFAQDYKRTMEGQKVPNVILRDLQRNEVSIQKLVEQSYKDSLLLFFWSSHCPYCLESIGKMSDHLLKGVEIIAISVDSDEAEWKHGIEEKNVGHWKHFSDLKAWDSETNKLLNVHRTPYFILLNKESVILSKPPSIDFLLNSLREKP